MSTVIKGSGNGQINLNDTTGSIQLNGSDVLTIDSSGNLTAPNNLTVTGTVTQTGGATFNGGITGNVAFDTDTLYVDATNNRVGIGTSSPADPLEISHATTSRMRFSETTNSLTLNVGQWGAKNRIEGSGGSDLIISNYDASNPIAFYTGSGGGNAERMRIDSSGRVGINKNPNNRAQLEIKAGTSTIHQLFLEQNNTEHGWQFYADQADGGLAFFRRDNSGQTERMRINTDGNVTIGTANSTSGGTKYYAGTSNSFWGNWVTSTATKNQWTFNNPNGEVGRITTNGSSTSFLTSSDYRLKENVVPMSGSINRLKQLKPSTWAWIHGGNGEGFLAHEAQAVVPECVTGTKDEVDDEGNPVYQGIDQSKLVPLLTAALQEAITKIEDLETRIQALESANV